MGLSAQPTTVMKAGGLRIKHGSPAVLYCHHKLCGQDIKDGLLWRVWLQSGSCSSVLSGCLDTQVEKGVVSLWQNEGFTAGSPDKSQCNIWSQGPDKHSRPRAWGKAFPRRSPTGWCLLRADCISRSSALVKACKLGLLCSCHWWAKSIKVWSLNYRCLSAAGSFQVSSSNVLLRILNKPTCSSPYLIDPLWKEDIEASAPNPLQQVRRRSYMLLCISKNAEFIPVQVK